MELVLLSLCIIISSCTHVAAAVNKSLQSCPTLCDPRDGSPPGSSVPGYSPGKNIGVGFHALLQGVSHPQMQI